MEPHLAVPVSRKLTPQAHKPSDLIKAAVPSFLTTTPQTEERKKKLRQWFWRFRRAVDFKHKYTSTETTQLMREGWMLLSETFFLAQLSDTPVDWDLELWLNDEAYGVTSGVGNETKVKLYPYASIDNDITAKALLITLAHEAAHAFIRRYSCWCDFCGVDWCQETRDVSIGVKGNGLTWQGLTKAIEDRSEYFFGFRLDLGRRRSTVREHPMLDGTAAVKVLFGGVDPRS